MLVGDEPVTRESEIAERLDAIVDELDELAFEQLQEALADGATRRPASDKVLTQARRAVQKGARLLRDLDDSGTAGGTTGAANDDGPIDDD